MADEQKTPLPPPFKREDVDPITHAKLQEARGRIIGEAMRRNHEAAVSRMAQAEERQAWGEFKRRRGVRMQYEQEKQRAGEAFANRQRGAGRSRSRSR